MPSIISAGTTANTGLNLTADTSGNLVFQTNGNTTAMTIDTSQNVTYANGVSFTGVIAGNGANISSMNASNLTSGTVANARTTAASANGASTIVLRDSSGDFSAGVITANGSALTAINASNISSGTVATARLASGTANSTTYLRGDQTWATVSGGVTSLNGNTGALQGMTLLSTTSFTSATTIDITGIPTTAGTTYLLQIVAQTPNNGGLTQTRFSLRYSTNNGSTFATTAIMSSMPNYNTASPYPSCIQGYMGDVFWTISSGLSYTTSVFANMFIRNGVSNGYPSAFSTSLAGDFENLDGYGSFYTGYQGDQDTNGFMSSGAGTVRNATFNALRIIRRSGDQVVTGVAKLYVLGV